MVLLTISVYAFYRLALFWEVSAIPLLTLLPVYVLAGLLLYLPTSPIYLRSDGEFYQRWGYSLAAAWLSGEPMPSDRALWPGKGLWPLIIAGFSAIGGPVTTTLIVFNGLILVLTVLLLQKATLLFTGRSTRWSMVVIALTSAPFAIWGPSLLREAIFWLGVSFGALALSYASVRRYRPSLLSVGISSLITLGIRPDAGIVLTYGFVAALILVWAIQGRKLTWLWALGISITQLFLALSLPSALQLLTSSEINGDVITAWNDALAAETVTTGFGSRVGLCDSIGRELALSGSVLCSAVVNLPFAMFGPFYWEYGASAIWFIAGASTLHFLVLAGLATIFVVISKGFRWPMLATLLVAAGSMLMFSSVLTNYGILIRFRAATEVLLIPLALGGALAMPSWARISRMKQALQFTLKRGFQRGGACHS